MDRIAFTNRDVLTETLRYLRDSGIKIVVIIGCCSVIAFNPRILKTAGRPHRKLDRSVAKRIVRQIS